MTLHELREGLRHSEQLEPDTRVDLERALNRIPRQYKQLLVLHYCSGYTQREAMDAAGSRSWRDWARAERALLEEMNA